MASGGQPIAAYPFRLPKGNLTSMSRAVLSLLLLAAGPALAEQLPVPPVPPARMLSAEVAPVPNREAQTASASPKQHASLGLRSFQSTTDDSGLAFAPGSRYRTPEERKPVHMPGVSLIVPIE